MTTDEIEARWKSLCDVVADRMKVFTRPFVTPLIQDVVGTRPRVGTGTFIDQNGVSVLTCEHVARHAPFLYQFNGNEPLVELPATWRADPFPIDAATAIVHAELWGTVPHLAQPLSLSCFAARHDPVEHEVFFFRGASDENVTVGAVHSRIIPSGYCTQEKPGGGDAKVFELLWEPLETTVTQGTSDEVAKLFKYDDPAGFSGSLVWNTRFVEKGCDLSKWSPGDAVVTGLLREWDTGTKTLLVWRVEHLLAWLIRP